MKKLDLTSLKKALTSLQKAIERYGLEPEDEEVRDSVIQRFEYSYELCWKMLSKQLQLGHWLIKRLHAGGNQKRQTVCLPVYQRRYLPTEIITMKYLLSTIIIVAAALLLTAVAYQAPGRISTK